MSDERKACIGGATVPVRMGPEYAQACQHCGTRVRDDMIDHPFFGFAAGCQEPDDALKAQEQA